MKKSLVTTTLACAILLNDFQVTAIGQTLDGQPVGHQEHKDLMQATIKAKAE